MLNLLTGRIADHKVDEGGRAAAAHTVGILAMDEVGNVYRYCQNDTDAAIDQYDLCTYSTHASFIVTQDVSEGDTYEPAGVYDESTSVAVSEYFWLKVGGRGTVNSETATVVDGDPLIAHATADGEADEAVAAATDTTAIRKDTVARIFGYAEAAESAGTPDTTAFRFVGGWLP